MASDFAGGSGGGNLKSCCIDSGDSCWESGPRDEMGLLVVDLLGRTGGRVSSFDSVIMGGDSDSTL